MYSQQAIGEPAHQLVSYEFSVTYTSYNFSTYYTLKQLYVHYMYPTVTRNPRLQMLLPCVIP